MRLAAHTALYACTTFNTDFGGALMYQGTPHFHELATTDHHDHDTHTQTSQKFCCLGSTKAPSSVCIATLFAIFLSETLEWRLDLERTRSDFAIWNLTNESTGNDCSALILKAACPAWLCMGT